MADVEARVSAEPLDIGAAIAATTSPDCGGLGVFIGTVRSSAAVPGTVAKEVIGLEYEHHPTLAGKRMVEIAGEAARKWGLHKVTALHRTGACGVGEPTVVVVTAAPHRAESLEACRWIIDAIKAHVPIWKRELYADGSVWVGSEAAR